MKQFKTLSSSKKRQWIPFILLFFLMGGILFVFIRGSWSPSISDPSRSSEGVRCKYDEMPDGEKWARCVFVVERSMNETKAILTNYSQYKKLPGFRSSSAVQKDATHVLFSGEFHFSLYDSWQFSSLMEHQQAVSQFVASWRTQHSFVSNQGNITLQRLDAKRTQVSYSVHARLKYIPVWITQYILFEKLPRIVESAKSWVENTPEE